MRIALVHPKFDLSGGAERYALGLAQGLAARGHEVHLFGRRAEGVPEGSIFHRVLGLPLGRAVKTWSFAAAAARAVGAQAFDVVQGFGKTTCQTVHRCGGGVHRAYREGQGRDTPTLYDRIATGIEDKLFASKELRTVICPSKWVAREVVRFYPAATERIRVIPNGVDTELFQEQGRDAARLGICSALDLPSEAVLLLFVATNFRLKGLGTAIGCLSHLPDARLLVLGGDKSEAYAAQARDLGVGERIRFLGAVRDPAPYYRAADVLVHPTLYDPFANCCLEALACGTPVVTTEENGAADVLEQVGVVLPSAAPVPAFVAGIEQLTAAGDEVRRQARLTALAHSHRVHLDRVLRVYEDVWKRGALVS